ncbi:hypothetical protein NP493_1975g00004 [Ridgeia piscesae]|uniref:Uncharacterized protein n=1 Tax=Ridgeia piscesae TaxID=27915 RepID=A0AAD9JPW0_RIDPI|nr:hypothetical protein NP493_1975g00004 [Ridgeia piscesae]
MEFVRQDTTAALRKDLDEILAEVSFARRCIRGPSPNRGSFCAIRASSATVGHAWGGGAGSQIALGDLCSQLSVPLVPDRRVPGTGSMGQPTSYSGTVPHISGRLRNTVGILLQASLAPPSILQYERAWSKLDRGGYSSSIKGRVRCTGQSTGALVF